MGTAISQARQWFSVRRTIAALVVVVCLSAPVVGAVGATTNNAESITTTESVAYAQSGLPVSANGTVAINETASNRSRIVLKNVTLPEHGYIVARIGDLSANQSATKVVGHTEYVRNGSYHGVILVLNESVAKGATVVVTLHNDTSRNETWDGIQTDVAYSANGTPVHDSIQFTQNQSASNSTASVVFGNQTTNGTNVVIRSVTLPEGGFIVVHGPAYAQQGVVSGSAITVSRYLEPGTYHNLTISFARGVPGAVSNISEFSGVYAPLSAVLYQDTNGNHQFDYVETFGQNDTAYRQNGSRVDDQAHVVTQEQLARKTQPTAALTFTNQSAADGTLTIKRVRLPSGGWVVIHNQTYITENDPLTTVVGHSEYLSAGVHRSVTVTLDRPLARSQTVIGVVYRDTNGNKRYDYVRSRGMADYAYVNRSAENATLVSNRAHVSVPSAITTLTPSLSSTTADASGTTTPTTNRSSASGGIFPSASMVLKGSLAVVLVVVGLALIGRAR